MASDRHEALGTQQFGPFVEGLDYPMYVVTAASDGQRGGCLAGFTSQVSIDPPRFLVCISLRNHTYRVACEASHLAVHLLGPGRLDLARLFGTQTGDEVDKFEQCRWQPGPHGVPILGDAPRHLVGRILGRTPFGDHTGFLLEPIEVTVSTMGSVLTFADVKDLDPGHGA